MELKIYNGNDGTLKLTASPGSSSTVTEEVMGEYCMSASFTHTAFVMLDANDYVLLQGVKYKIRSPYRPAQKNTQTYSYSVKFYAPIHDAEDALFLFEADGEITTEFSYDGGPSAHLQLWVDNMNRIAGQTLWTVGTVIGGESKTIEYKNVYCWDAAFGSSGIAATFGTELWADGYTVNLCKAERGERIELGYLQGLTQLSQEDNGEVRFFTRLFPLGSTRNIDASKYGYVRLQLPSRAKYVDKNTDLYGIKDAYEEEAFSGIYPRYTGSVTALRTEQQTNEEGREYTIYYIKDSGMAFNPNDYEIPEQVKMLAFQTGDLAGRGDQEDGSFQANWHADTGEWEIINVYPDETTQLPGGEIVPKVGDTYIPWNFSLPQEYITAAEQEYAEAVDEYLSTYSFDIQKYNGTTDRNYIENNRTPLMVGQNVRLLSEEYFADGYKDTRITKIVRKLCDLCQATVTCTDRIGTGWKASVDNRLENLQYELARQNAQTIIDIIKTTDAKTPSDWNVFSALRSRAEFISKKFNDTVIGILTFLQSAFFRGGAIFGKDGYAGGMTGYGAQVDEYGNAEVESLTSRRYIETPEFRFNSIEIFLGDKWRAPGGGLIDTVDTANKICTLKLEEGQIGAVDTGDICMGIFHSLTATDNAAEDTDDSRGNRTFAGFCTVYFTITEVMGDRNERFKYQLRPVSERWKFSFDPFEMMNFVAYGSFTNTDRQTSVYETRTYTRMLKGQNDWEISKANIKKQSGDLSNLSVFGMNLEGYSEYTDSVYFTGTITQVKPDGTPVKTANDRGAWPPADNHASHYDRFSYNGSLWLCVNEDGTNEAPVDGNPDWLKQVDKGEQGDSMQLLGPWENGKLVPKLGVVTMGGNSFAAKVATYNPPMFTLTDGDGNRIKTGTGYILTGEINTAEYDIIAEKGQKGLDGLQGEKGIPGEKGADGKTTYFHIKYSPNPDGNPMTETTSTYIGTYVDFEEVDSDDPAKYAWARFEGLQGQKGEQGIPGYNGVDGKTYYLHIKYSNDGGLSFTGNGGEDAGDYIGQYTDTNANDSSNPADYKWAKIKGEKGEQGESMHLLGPWYDGLLVPKLGVVTMAGNSFAAKVATYNPPMFTLMDGEGRRLKTDSGYIITGEINTAEYDVVAEKGDKGEDGKDGAPGQDGKEGKQGIAGCVVRDSEWALDTEYRNDSNITDGSLDIRYIDVALVWNDATETGWDVYQCLKTHVSSESITYANTSYWRKFSANVGAIFTSLIIAKNAKIKFLQGNQLLIQKSDGTVTTGLSGSEEGEKIRFWVGDENPETAPYRIDEAGNVVQGNGNLVTNADGSGKIGNGGVSWDTKGNVRVNSLFTTPFSYAAGILQQLTQTWIHEIKKGDTWLSNDGSNYIVDSSDGYQHLVILPQDKSYAGAVVRIYNMAEALGESKVKVRLVPGVEVQVPAASYLEFLCVATKDEFIKWMYT